MALSRSTVLHLLLVACSLFAGGDASSDKVGDRPVIVSAVPRNWFVAREVCISYGKTLLEIHTVEENLEAESLLEKYKLESAWIGANDLGEDDQYHWTDGKKVLNQFWAPGSWDDKGGSQDCVAIASSEKHPKNWFDRECEKKYAFICQD